MRSEHEFLKPERLRESLRSLGKKLSITERSIDVVGSCSARDAVWNHMDQLHRPYVHRTYTEALRFARTENIGVSLTTIKLGFVPVFMLVTDVHLGAGRFYQCFTVLGVIYFHVFIEMDDDGDQCRQRISWFIVSHPLFKFLHGFLSRRYERLNIVQNAEDEPVRMRRREIRKQGYAFVYDDVPLDYLNSNELSDRTIYPQADRQRIELASLRKGETNRVSAGPLTLLVQPRDDGSVLVWTEVCPHEGASLDGLKDCDGVLQCQWHGLKFKAARLSRETPTGGFHGLEFVLDGDALTVDVNGAAAKRGG